MYFVPNMKKLRALGDVICHVSNVLSFIGKIPENSLYAGKQI